MNINYNKVAELAESWVNGNISFVKKKVKRLNKVEFVQLCSDIQHMTGNNDINTLAFNLTN